MEWMRSTCGARVADPRCRRRTAPPTLRRGRRATPRRCGGGGRGIRAGA